MLNELESDLGGLKKAKLVNNTVGYKRSTLPTLLECLDKPATTLKDMRNFVDVGCGVGQIVLAWGCTFNHMDVYGVELDEKRLAKLEHRMKDYVDYGLITERVHLIHTDITKDYNNNEQWRFLTEGKTMIYYNNFNLSGEVDHSFANVVEKYAAQGSLIICYRGEMFNRSDKVELVSETEIEVGGEQFSWMQKEHKVTVNLFRKI